ncbi:hypothetical protein PROFUN_01592 [Planoprotostelium fungivorum]|uniref:Uncharacterized protein n=1 Tax=Planoprotostelium fungivorum TaxID=1890364 RepID=A0A2P6NTT7_9EUKA|nr:hypothetical protein PROFUN_01592 [Planoprotostelium fungivorum]
MCRKLRILQASRKSRAKAFFNTSSNMSSSPNSKKPFLKGIKDIIRRSNGGQTAKEETVHEQRTRINRLNDAALEIFCPLSGEDFLNGSFQDIEHKEMSNWQVLVEKEYKTISKSQSADKKSRPKAALNERTNHLTMPASILKASKSESFTSSPVKPSPTPSPTRPTETAPRIPPRPSTLRHSTIAPPPLPARPSKAQSITTPHMFEPPTPTESSQIAPEISIETTDVAVAKVIEPITLKSPEMTGRICGKARMLSPSTCRSPRPQLPPRPTSRPIYNAETKDKSPLPPVPRPPRNLEREASAKLLAAFSREETPTSSPEEEAERLERVLDLLSHRMGFPVKTAEHALKLINMAGFHVKTMEKAESVVSTLQSDSSFYSGANYHSRDNFSSGDYQVSQ